MRAGITVTHEDLGRHKAIVEVRNRLRKYIVRGKIIVWTTACCVTFRAVRPPSGETPRELLAYNGKISRYENRDA